MTAPERFLHLPCPGAARPDHRLTGCHNPHHCDRVPEAFVQVPTAVQAMRLETVADTHRAYGWLLEHGVFAAIRIGQRHGHIVASGETGTTLSVGIGDWLVFCPATGHFTAYEDEEFRTLHRRPTPAPEVAS